MQQKSFLCSDKNEHNVIVTSFVSELTNILKKKVLATFGSTFTISMLKVDNVDFSIKKAICFW